MLVRLLIPSFAVGIACGGQPAEAPAPSVMPAATPSHVSRPTGALSAAPTGASTAAAAPSSTSTDVKRGRPDAAAIFARLHPGLVRCYEEGRKSTPTMLDGKLTLNASVDATGRTTCTIPTDDTGLTQEVEDCMSARLTAEKFDPDAMWTAVVPIAVRGGVVGLGERATGTAGIESVETHRMPDAFEVLESLVPELQSCIRELDKSTGVQTIIVGARVGLDGRPTCALASPNAGVLPPKISACATSAFASAKFPPPKGGPGLVLVPIRLSRR
jgi:hypothetical protein